MFILDWESRIEKDDLRKKPETETKICETGESFLATWLILFKNCTRGNEFVKLDNLRATWISFFEIIAPEVGSL